MKIVLNRLESSAWKFGICLNISCVISLQRYGVWADWNNPYLTLDPEYEAAQVVTIGFMRSL